MTRYLQKSTFGKMEEALPGEIKRYAKYYYAAESISKYNKTVAQVLGHVFADYCVDEILPLTASPNAHRFITTYIQTLGPFPCDGPAETRYFANDLYDSLSAVLQSGKITKNLADQFWLCSTVYSVLDGEESEIREQMCRFAALSLRKLLSKQSETENRERIRADLEQALIMIKQGDREATKRHLQDALRLWKRP